MKTLIRITLFFTLVSLFSCGKENIEPVNENLTHSEELQFKSSAGGDACHPAFQCGCELFITEFHSSGFGPFYKITVNDELILTSGLTPNSVDLTLCQNLSANTIVFEARNLQQQCPESEIVYTLVCGDEDPITATAKINENNVCNPATTFWQASSHCEIEGPFQIGPQ